MKRFLKLLAAAGLLIQIASAQQNVVVTNQPMTWGGILSSVPLPALLAGMTVKTYDPFASGAAVGNTPGKLYYPAGFYGYTGGGTVVTNGDNSITVSQGHNTLPQIATAQFNTGGTNNWKGLCFKGGGYFLTQASWTPINSLGQTSWPFFVMYDVNTTGANAISVGAGNVWQAQTIVATGAVTNGATSVNIPAWQGTNYTTVAAVSVAGTAGQFAATLYQLYVGETLTISGTLGGSGSIAGYTSPTTYYVSAVGAGTFSLQTMSQTPIVTTSGTLTGLTFTPGLSGTISFSDGETALASFTPGATSAAWTTGALSACPGGTCTTLLSVSWGSDFGIWPELDVVEQDTGGDAAPLTSLNIDGFIGWYGRFGANARTVTNFASITGINTATSNQYSVLWKPATTLSQGSITWYFNGAQVNQATYNLFDPNAPPAPTGTNTNQHLWTGGSAFSIIDQKCMMMNWGTAAGTLSPMNITSIQVWQTSGASNQVQ